MEEWIRTLLNSDQAGIITLIGAFFLGMLGLVTCACNYALFAVVAGYSASISKGEKPKSAIPSGIAFLVGTVISMAIIGIIVGFAGRMIGSSPSIWWKVISGILCIFFGLWSMDFLPFRIPAIKIGPGKIKPGILSALIFGLTVGGISIGLNSCCNPVFPIVLAATFIKGSTIWGLLLLVCFALGYSLPLTLGFTGINWGLGKLSGFVGKLSQIIPYVAGGILVLMGFYFLLTI